MSTRTRAQAVAPAASRSGQLRCPRSPPRAGPRAPWRCTRRGRAACRAPPGPPCTRAAGGARATVTGLRPSPQSNFSTEQEYCRRESPPLRRKRLEFLRLRKISYFHVFDVQHSYFRTFVSTFVLHSFPNIRLSSLNIPCSTFVLPYSAPKLFSRSCGTL